MKNPKNKKVGMQPVCSRRGKSRFPKTAPHLPNIIVVATVIVLQTFRKRKRRPSSYVIHLDRYLILVGKRSTTTAIIIDKATVVCEMNIAANAVVV